MLGTSVGKILDKVFNKYAERTAFDIDGKQYTYAETRDSVNRLANGFVSLGLNKGDRILIMTVNCVEYLFADYAAAKAGLIKIPINTMQVKSDIEYRLRDTEASAVIIDEFFYDRYGFFFDDFPSVKHVIVISNREDILSQDVLSLHKLMEQSPATEPEDTCQPEDVLAIMYTGGTTGAAKGVMHTHQSFISIVYSTVFEFDISDGEIMLQTAPLPHAAGFMVTSCMLRGGKTIIHPQFNPEAVCATIEKDKVNWTFMVPTMVYAMLDYPDRKKYNLSSLRTITYGAAPMSPRRLEEAITELGPIFLQGYSQMEVANQTCVLSKRQHVEAIENGKKARFESCGMPILMSQVKIVDNDGNTITDGSVGELVTTGPHVMKGYWRKEEDTAETIVKGWLHTGDMARVDEDGYIYLVDRKKDMIISGGMNVYSAEVESALALHPGVAETIVIGIPDDKWGELVTAVIVKASGTCATEEDLTQHCKNNLSAYKIPKRFEFVESIPRTNVGKFDKKAVREKFWQGTGRSI